jgi:Leucine-rich repeat (LRR) protein
MELPKEIGSIKTLRELNLRGNQLQRLPDSLASLAGLQILDIEQNEFKVRRSIGKEINKQINKEKNK